MVRYNNRNLVKKTYALNAEYEKQFGKTFVFETEEYGEIEIQAKTEIDARIKLEKEVLRLMKQNEYFASGAHRTDSLEKIKKDFGI